MIYSFEFLFNFSKVRFPFETTKAFSGKILAFPGEMTAKAIFCIKVPYVFGLLLPFSHGKIFFSTVFLPIIAYIYVMNIENRKGRNTLYREFEDYCIDISTCIWRYNSCRNNGFRGQQRIAVWIGSCHCVADCDYGICVCSFVK